MKHALVIGGTGMLADVSLWLVDNGFHVSVVARGAERMERLMEKASSNHHITPLFVDYRNGDELRKKISETIKQNGEIDLVVAWIHSTAKDALPMIVEEVSAGERDWELYHVLGSRTNLSQMKKKISQSIHQTYYQIQLGFIDEGTHSRWLTNEEISTGVIEAIKQKNNVTVGQLEF